MITSDELQIGSMARRHKVCGLKSRSEMLKRHKRRVVRDAGRLNHRHYSKSADHALHKEHLVRLHTDMDRTILEHLIKKGYPLFTADPYVSQASGIPIWTGALPA